MPRIVSADILHFPERGPCRGFDGVRPGRLQQLWAFPNSSISTSRSSVRDVHAFSLLAGETLESTGKM